PCGHRCWNVLRNKILFFTRNTVIKRPAVHRRQLFSKVTMAGGYGSDPLETIRVPRITFHDAFSGEDTDEKVQDKDQLSRAQYKGGDGDKDINRLLGLQEDVLRRIVNPAHLAANADNVHGEKHAIGSNKRQPEV